MSRLDIAESRQTMTTFDVLLCIQYTVRSWCSELHDPSEEILWLVLDQTDKGDATRIHVNCSVVESEDVFICAFV